MIPKSFLFCAMGAMTSFALTPSAIAAPPQPPQFAQCAVCHKTRAGEKSTIGPNLFGIAGRKSGVGSDFNFSPAMKQAGIVWNKSNLLAFIASPQTVVKGNRMPFGGQKDPKAAAAIAEYLASLK